MRSLAIVAAVWLAVASSPASACLNPVLLKGDRAIQLVKRAESLLRAGKYARILSLLEEYELGDRALGRRARLVELTAELRSLVAEKAPDLTEVRYVAQRLRLRLGAHDGLGRGSRCRRRGWRGHRERSLRRRLRARDEQRQDQGVLRARQAEVHDPSWSSGSNLGRR